jgi:DNA-binding MurR/RpiR family transcriptional regulator
VTVDEPAPLAERIAERLAGLSPAERKVAEFLRNQAGDILFASAGEIGELTGTSDATVVRTAKALGYSGLPELKRQLGQQVTRTVRPALRLRHRIERVGEASAMLDRVFAEAAERVGETHRLTDPAAFSKAVDLLADAREVFTFGIGLSGVVADYLAMRLVRLGRPARSTAHTGFRLADELLPLRSGDAVVVYAAGRLLADIEVILWHAGEVGATTILITDSLGPVLGDRVDVWLAAAHSPSGFTGETLSASIVTDALLLAVAARHDASATATSDRLTGIRRELLGHNPDLYVPKRGKLRRKT